MYKFNFLYKINQMKLEEAKKAKFVKNVFIASTCCILAILGLLMLKSTQVGSLHKEMTDKEQNLIDKTAAFRKAEFFRYKLIEHVYNTALKRKQISKINDMIESSLDSTIAITSMKLNSNYISLGLISKTQGSKSQLMTIANNVKSTISDNLKEMGYLDEKKGVVLSRSPDIKTTVGDIQYWEFEFGINLVSVRQGVKVAVKKP
jgi:hypothetical protein